MCSQSKEKKIAYYVHDKRPKVPAIHFKEASACSVIPLNELLECCS